MIYILNIKTIMKINALKVKDVCELTLLTNTILFK